MAIERETTVGRVQDSIELRCPVLPDDVHHALDPSGERNAIHLAEEPGPKFVRHRSAATRLAHEENRNIGRPDVKTIVPDSGHRTVLLEPAVSALAPRLGGVYVDATFGGGGHTRALLEHVPSVEVVYAIDADGDAIVRARELALEPGFTNRLIAIHSNFGRLREIAESRGFRSLDGVLMDLGLSSFQLDEAERGFAFRFDAPLDMRYDRERGKSARDLVNSLPESELASIIWRLGEESRSRRIATAIVRSRERSPIDSTAQLAAIVERAVGGRKGRGRHPATRTFQAIRIEVNAELETLRSALRAAVDLLSPGGRMVVISFHSLEDRLVKQIIAAEATTCVCPQAQPICTCDTIPRLGRVGRAVKPSKTESELNPRSRSAIMRVAEKVDSSGIPIVRGG